MQNDQTGCLVILCTLYGFAKRNKSRVDSERIGLETRVDTQVSSWHLSSCHRQDYSNRRSRFAVLQNIAHRSILSHEARSCLKYSWQLRDSRLLAPRSRSSLILCKIAPQDVELFYVHLDCFALQNYSMSGLHDKQLELDYQGIAGMASVRESTS